MYLIECEIFREYNRPRERAIETLFNQDTICHIISFGTPSLSGDGEDITRYGDINTVRIYSGYRSDDDYLFRTVQDIKCYLPQFLFYDIVVFYLDLDRTMSVSVPMVSM